MKKKDFKLIGIYYVLIILVIIGVIYFKTKPKKIDYASYSINQNEAKSEIKTGDAKPYLDGTLTVGVGNDGVYETDDYYMFITDVTDENTWITTDFKEEYDFTQQIQDYSFLPNTKDFEFSKGVQNQEPTDNMPLIIENYLWGYGFDDNYFKDYKLWYYTTDIDDELQLCLIGWADDDEANYLNFYVINNYGLFDESLGRVPELEELPPSKYNETEIALTDEDATYITYYIDRYDKYPTKEEVDIKGVIPFEKYQEIFELRPLEGRDAQHVIGKPLERYPGYEEEFK